MENDDRCERALERANRSATIHLAKQNLRHRVEDLLILAVHGGTFKVTRELINFVDLLSREHSEHVKEVLIDDYGNPIMIADLVEFRRMLMERYHSTVNEYYLSYRKLASARSTREAVIGDE